MFVWRGILQAKNRKQKVGGKPFVIAVVSGLEIPFFGYSKDYLENLEIGQEVIAVVHEGERNGFPSISGFFCGVVIDAIDSGGFAHE